MSYKIELSDNFKKEAKRLVKKYRSLKTEIANLITELETNPTKALHLEMIFTKFVLLLLLKEKVNPVD
jgi:mRNA-degrading endonuclease YafQ of YafQ-DinJ toxin-antitoxin module